LKPVVFILHILPIELYPPIINLLKYERFNSLFSVTVITSYNNKNRLDFISNSIRIKRLNYFGFSKNFLKKVFLLFWYNIAALYSLLRQKPSIILYYEPHSSFPVYFYKRFINTRVDVFIHYHELYTKDDLDAKSMKSIKYFNDFERKYLYPKAKWISQTNRFRLAIFKEENPNASSLALKVFPNYPPSHWNQKKFKLINNKVIRAIYFGAISFENTYIREVVSFFSKFPQLIKLDIYSYNFHNDVEEYFRINTFDNIDFHKKGIDYFDIPKIALNYDLGLILYKGHNLNYTYNAPNKLFEYLSCGLNVWFPIEILGCEPYVEVDSTPCVKRVDFNKINEEIISDHFESMKLSFKASSFSCESEFDKLINSFLN
jgi:hypothetical protein